jgi:hypothetical protein
VTLLAVNAMLRCDLVKDFAPVALLATAPSVLIVRASLPVYDLRWTGFSAAAADMRRRLLGMQPLAVTNHRGHEPTQLLLRALPDEPRQQTWSRRRAETAPQGLGASLHLR